MIILSIGMPRAGSGWYYNLTNDMMLAQGAQDARDIREKYHLENILTEVNCNIGALTPRRLLSVLAPSLMGNTFVIKAHSGPTPLALALIRRGFVRATYVYRDPRDALLSAMENGRRAVERERANAFSPYVEFDAALGFMQKQMRIWEAWQRCTQVHQARYEDLLTDYDAEAEKLAAFLELPAGEPTVSAVINRYRPETAHPERKGIHFSQGKIGRFRSALDADRQQRLQQVFGTYLERMGYPA